MKSILTIIVIVLALVPATLYAGAVATETLSIEFESEDSGEASGNMWLTRSSKNDLEIIGCSFKGELDGQGGSYKWGWCRARDASGLEVFCITEDENLLDALQAISPLSWVRFVFENAYLYQPDVGDAYYVADCTRFDISTQSLHLPNFATAE